jgi:protein TonB
VVDLPSPVPLHPLQVVLAHAVQMPPRSAPRAATSAPHYAPTEAPREIVPERPQPAEAVPDVPIAEGGVPSGFGGDAGAIPLRMEGPPAPPPPPPVKPAGPVRIHTGMQSPQKIVDVKPVYPPFARAAHVQGVVVLDAVLGVDGRVDQVRVLRSVPLLDQAAIDAVRQWRYTPTLLNGEPVRVLMTITINFKLDE